MKNDFRHYCLVSLFLLDEIDAVKLVNNDLSDNQVLRAEQLLINTKTNIDTILNVLEENSLNWSVERIGKAEKTSLILGISELMLNLTPFKVIEEIQEIKLKRDQFLKSFAPGEVAANDIVNASKDIYLQSIRVHKLLTSNGEIGKVATAKFLESLDLNENTKLFELNNSQIEAIIEYVKQ